MKEYRRIFNYLCGSVTVAMLTGCAGATVTFQSSPEKAEVFARSLSSGGEMQSLGETPVSISGSDLSKKIGTSGPAQVELRKGGYVTKNMLVTDPSSADLTITTELAPANGLEDVTKLNSMIDQIFESQRLVRAGRSNEALKILQELKKGFPQVATIYELEGGIYYLGKLYKEALDSYGQAIKRNPKNTNAIKIYEKLENTLGVKHEALPSSKVDAPKEPEKPKSEDAKPEEKKEGT